MTTHSRDPCFIVHLSPVRRCYPVENEFMKKKKNAEIPQETIDKLDSILHIIETADYCRNAIFWTPGDSSSLRRYHEKLRNLSEITWEEGGDLYTAEYSYYESCRNVYARGIYTRNGEITTLKAIRNSALRIAAAKSQKDGTDQN